MIPAALANQLEVGLADFLRMSFWSSTPGMEGVIERLLQTPGGVLKGPYVSAKLPFARGGAAEFFPEVPLGFPAHRHQEEAFKRLAGSKPKSTLVATGTGSGKTESFLWPILDHCRHEVGQPGIKAILVYPMNALATDQAGRIARAIHGSPALAGAVRAGLYIGESPGEKRKTHKTMGPDHVITDRKKLQLDPPDILLTNYKMLDYLLIRPADQPLWQHNLGGPLRFLVVDELHTFDGAQGTDLACLIRRLKARLGVEPGSLCCVGTSATLGGGDSIEALRAYAEDIFGEPFDPASVIGEQRLTPAAFFTDRLIEFAGAVPASARDGLDPSRYPNPAEYLKAQQALWFDEPLESSPGTSSWRVELGEQLLRHGMLRNLVTLLAGGPVEVELLIDGIGRASRPLRDDRNLARLALVSFLSLISEARSWLPEREDARLAREEAGTPRRTRPFLEVRLQLWQRELRRMVASIAPEPTLRFSDDLTDEQKRHHLPLVHCRDCGAMGWATHQHRDKPDVYRTSTERFYRAFFSNDPQVRFLWPADAAPTTGSWSRALRFPLDQLTLVRVHDEDPDPDEVVPVVVSESVVTERGQQRLDRDCPFCSARGSLTLLGFRAATLTSVYIDQLFASRFNDDKKLLTFSDSVQDAAHRAGFFGARTWRFNLRVALQTVLDAAGPLSLESLPDAFAEHWRGPAGLTDEAYASTFLAPAMEWFPDYERLKEAGAVPDGSTLVQDVDRRVAFEAFTEFGHQARIGRSLPRTGSATVQVDPDLLNAAAEALLGPLQNEIGGLRELDAPTLRTFLLGALHHLRGRGGLAHRELPEEFALSGGRDWFLFNKRPHLPGFRRTSRMPALLTDESGSSRFDSVSSKSNAGSWYERWVDRCLGQVSPLIGAASDIWALVLPALSATAVLQQFDGHHGRVWGLRPAALQLSTATVRLRCDRCSAWQVVTQSEAPSWEPMPCLTARCDGRYEREAQAVNYFGRLYRQGQVERVFTAEHTGLLTRGVREAVEAEFKVDQAERKTWFPNLLSCTPTLEMGIDIGALSSAILCSVPPAQANYLQRIGRAGRRDGNSLLLTVAQAKPHDLYFYAQPEEMIAGDVSPPGVFLNASAVLERQLAAFCLDRWNADGVPADAIPRRLSKVFEHLDDAGMARFPHNWLDYVRGRDQDILSGFFELFGDRLGTESQQHLREFLLGDREDQGSLGWKILDVLRGERKQRDSLRGQARKVKAAYDKLAGSKAKNKDHDDQLSELKRERGALERLVKQIEGTSVLQFLTDHGLLPNYAFPESPIRLRSVIWRRKQHKSEKDKSGYETRTFEYARPAMAAISELAPDNRFFAGGRHVTIDQVDVATASLETWRFCDQCSYSLNLDQHGDHFKDCPSCESPVWGEDSQKGQLLKLEQVFANTSDRRSRIRDDQEERQPRHYNKRMLMSFDGKERDGAWHIDDEVVPFAFEYVRRARFQEINFGEFTDSGSKVSIAGREEVRQGFAICRACGKVQPKPPRNDKAPPPKPEHTLWCPSRKKEAATEDFQAAVYLYREFSSEALRLLLPLSDIGSDRQLNSFLAAFQLGLRDKYGGRVDHLHTLVYSEPEGDGYLRRQYLVLYDTVPGGTGYLKDFTRASAEPDAPHPLLDILQRALDRMTSCTCFHEPEVDGCYRCLFAYRNSREMEQTSSKEAVDLFNRILARGHKLKAIKALSDVSVSGMMDSVLEARFIEAFRRLGDDDRTVHVEKSMVRNKPGYRLSLGGQVWNIEQQLELGPLDGIHPTVSIDFVFRHGEAGSERRPIAVFLDGFQFHRDRVGLDLLQRMSLLSSGSFDVWSFTWFDIDEMFHTDVEEAPVLVHPDLPVLKAWLGKLGVGHAGPLFEGRLMDAFVASLADDAKPDWEQVATGTVIAQMLRPDEVDGDTWSSEVQAHAPASARPWFGEVDATWLRVHRPPTAAVPFGLWAAAPPQALTPPVDASAFRLLGWLDDSEDRLNTPEFRRQWRGFLHAFQFLRALPNGWFVTARQEHLDFGPLSQARLGPGHADAGQELWDSLDIDATFEPLVAKLAGQSLPIPDVGIDLPDARGHTSGLEGELVWEALKVAVVESLGDVERPVAAEWSVFELAALLEDIAPLLTALSGSHRDTAKEVLDAISLAAPATDSVTRTDDGWRWHTTRLRSSNAGVVALRQPSRLDLLEVPSGLSASLLDVAGSPFPDPLAALESLGNEVVEVFEWALRAPAHQLSAGDRRRKQAFLGLIDAVASNLVQPAAGAGWIFGEVGVDDEGRTTLDAGHAGIFYLEDAEQEVELGSWWFARVETDRAGVPEGRVAELRRASAENLDDLIRRWRERSDD